MAGQEDRRSPVEPPVNTLWICDECAWPFPWGTPPDDAECDHCGGFLIVDDGQEDRRSPVELDDEFGNVWRWAGEPLRATFVRTRDNSPSPVEGGQ